MLDIISRREESRKQPTEHTSKKCLRLTASARPISTLMRLPSRKRAIAAGISSGIPRLRATLFCVPVGMIPRVAFVARQRYCHGINRTVTPTHHEHADFILRGRS